MKMHKKIRTLRKEKKWSQAELAEKLKIHTTHVSRLESGSGKYMPSVELLRKMADVFEVSSDYLLKDEIEDYEVKVENKSLAEKVRLIDSLNQEDQRALLRMIDCMLTKSKMLELLTQDQKVLSK